MTDDGHQLVSAPYAREVLWHRQGGTCAACGQGMTPDAMHAHHRVRRAELGWCACNIVGLHPACHVVAPEAVHQRPAWALDRGLIVPTWADPRNVPLWVLWPWRAWSVLTCDGHVAQAEDGAIHPVTGSPVDPDGP